MADFTPGPWKKAGLYIVDLDHKNIIAGVVRKLGQDNEVEANGRLIAAAPDMYTLLSAGVEFLKNCGDCSDKGYKLRCAFEYLLARIDGEESNE